MAYAERAQDNSLAASAANTTGYRSVPVDWFVDPADPGASRRFQEQTSEDLEMQATAFLTEHEELEKREEFGLPLDLHTAVETPSALLDPQELAPGATRSWDSSQAKDDENTSPAIWLGLPGTSPDPAEDGELSWQADALCAQTDPEAFFPEKGGSTRDAKKVCGACTVRAQCLDYALQNDERFGIWGGMSERERRRLRKRAV